LYSGIPQPPVSPDSLPVIGQLLYKI
jgi:hypothetical protein